MFWVMQRTGPWHNIWMVDLRVHAYRQGNGNLVLEDKPAPASLAIPESVDISMISRILSLQDVSASAQVEI